MNIVLIDANPKRLMFYVYELIDPRTFRVFYVGKGRGSRLNHHESEARRGFHSRKCDLIRDVWSAGMQIIKRIVEQFEVEDDAYSFEARHILSIGLENLTNVVPGGRGGYAKYKTELERAAKARIPMSTLQVVIRVARETLGFTRPVYWCDPMRPSVEVEMTRIAKGALRALMHDWGVDKIAARLREANIDLKVKPC